jgi:hypothetical protein
MSELRFASANEALQHLANITGKRVKVAAQQFTFNDELMEKTDLATFKKRLPSLSVEELDGMWDAFSNLLLGATGAEKALLTRKQEATNEERDARLTVEAEGDKKTAKMKMNKKEVAKMLQYGISEFIDADDEHEVEEVTVTTNDEVLINFVDGTRFKVTVEQVIS